MDGRTDGRMDEWIYIYILIDEMIDGWFGVLMGRSIDILMDRWIDGRMNPGQVKTNDLKMYSCRNLAWRPTLPG